MVGKAKPAISTLMTSFNLSHQQEYSFYIQKQMSSQVWSLPLHADFVQHLIVTIKLM